MQYRKEIDGVRALAVLSVIFFHAGLPWFDGGYVGVDIFFVISGYLITSILKEDIQAGRFSLVDFYERRARRILPALFFVMLACLPAAWFILMPADWTEFAQSVAHVPAFVSNVLFSKQSGYFDVDAELKPLLHTWSLAVEEQYYLFFPLILLLSWKSGKRGVLMILAIIAISSLMYAQHKLQTRPSSAFFLLPSRLWELLVGSMLAFAAPDQSSAHRYLLRQQVGSMVGLFLMGYAIFAYDHMTPFPGLHALVPTLGAALVLHFSCERTIVGKVLSNKALVSIGLISYSAYLWHQPILSLHRHWTLSDPALATRLSLICLTLLLAYITWRYVETPFRRKDHFSRKAVFSLAGAGSVLLVVLGLSGQRLENHSPRLTPEQTAFLNHFDNSSPDWPYFTNQGVLQAFRTQCDFYDLTKYRQGAETRVPVPSLAPECFERSANAQRVLVLWGDSHAQQLYPGLRRALPSNWQILQITSSGCAPAFQARSDPSDYCKHANWFALDTIKRTQPDVVLLGQNLQHQASRMEGLARAIGQVSQARIIHTGPTPHWVADLPKIVVRHMWPQTPRYSHIGLDRKLRMHDTQLKATFASRPILRYVSLMDYLCHAKGCLVYSGNDRKKGLTSWDKGHLTPETSYLIARDVLAMVIQDEVMPLNGQR